MKPAITPHQSQSTEIETSSIPNSGEGVFTNIPLKKGVLFGPYVGVKVAPGVDKTVTDTSYMWEVRVSLFLMNNMTPTPPKIYNHAKMGHYHSFINICLLKYIYKNIPKCLNLQIYLFFLKICLSSAIFIFFINLC